jgi:hypothetical protein
VKLSNLKPNGDMIGDIKLNHPTQIKPNNLKIMVFYFLLREQIQSTE